MSESKDRRNINTTLSKKLYREIKILAAYKDDIRVNDLIEEGMMLVLRKHNQNIEELTLDELKMLYAFVSGETLKDDEIDSLKNKLSGLIELLSK